MICDVRLNVPERCKSSHAFHTYSVHCAKSNISKVSSMACSVRMCNLYCPGHESCHHIFHVTISRDYVVTIFFEVVHNWVSIPKSWEFVGSIAAPPKAPLRLVDTEIKQHCKASIAWKSRPCCHQKWFRWPQFFRLRVLHRSF